MESRPELAEGARRGLLASLWASLWTRVRATTAGVSIRRRERRLQLCETLSLGEKRMIAVVQFDDQRYLIAATPQNISLLQALGASPGDAEPHAPSR